MSRLARPWSGVWMSEDQPFGPEDCLLSETDSREGAGDHALLMAGEFRGQPRFLLQHPYPGRGSGGDPPRLGFPPRPRRGREGEQESFALAALARMEETTARVRELEEALDEPAELWDRLRLAWDRAENEADPRMAEIVRQARELTPILKDLRSRVRRVLRRHRELTPLDRAQELDRASMRWLSRQPGRTAAERAGADQRILAVSRREHFDTLENRVLHAYALLAAEAARVWLRAHPQAAGGRRHHDVQSFQKLCKALAAELADLEVGVAPGDAAPNYVLMEDKGYRLMREAWEKLLRREQALDDLWAWQAQTWTDFCVLALVLALQEMEGARLVAQAPIRFRPEADCGVWFDQERPIAVFWLPGLGRVAEVMARPERPGTLLTLARAHVALRISDPQDQSVYPHRVAVWTPHAMRRLDPGICAREALARLTELQRVGADRERIRHGLILTPGHGLPEAARAQGEGIWAEAAAFDASGESLAAGRAAIRAFLRSDLWRTPE